MLQEHKNNSSLTKEFITSRLVKARATSNSTILSMHSRVRISSASSSST